MRVRYICVCKNEFHFKVDTNRSNNYYMKKEILFWSGDVGDHERVVQTYDDRYTQIRCRPIRLEVFFENKSIYLTHWYRAFLNRRIVYTCNEPE